MQTRRCLCSQWWAIFEDPETGRRLDRPLFVLGNLRDGVVMPLARAIERGLLRDVRRARGDRQEDVAEVVPVSRETISRWENGHETPRPVSLRCLESYLLSPTRPAKDVKTL